MTVAALRRNSWLQEPTRRVESLRPHAIATDAGRFRAVLGCLEVTPLEVRREDDIAPAFAALNTRADPLYVVADALAAANARSIVTFALSARLPTFFQNRAFVQAGGLMSYGPSFPDMFRRTADLVDKILHGARPGDIPVEQPTKFEFVINLKTAKALGLTIPDRLLTTADEAIE
jgi:putative ABC transport system substrate-binding protein